MGERARYEHLLQTGEELLESARSQRVQLAKEMMAVRTPELLDQKIVNYLDVQGFPPEEIKDSYEKEKEQFERLFGTPDQGLKKNLLYHGTGFYKYDRKKYVQKQDCDESKVSPLFSEVLKTGLKTHQDTWLPDEDTDSVSLADSYFYAKWFASKNMAEDTKPKWQLGDPNDFFRFFMADTFKAELAPKKALKTGVEHFKNRKQRVSTKKDRLDKYENKLYEWTLSYRNDTTPDTTSMKELIDGNTDIENNFGVVLCLDKSHIDYQNLPIAGAHEVRTDKSISSKSIKAIGVPLAKVDEIKKLLQEKGEEKIEVFALECADLHFASFQIEDLVARVE